MREGSERMEARAWMRARAFEMDSHHDGLEVVVVGDAPTAAGGGGGSGRWSR